jgi:hypothetical protein
MEVRDAEERVWIGWCEQLGNSLTPPTTIATLFCFCVLLILDQFDHLEE